MNIKVESEMHRRRRSQNIGVAACLLFFIGLVTPPNPVTRQNQS